MSLPRSILVPIDNSAHAVAALDYACDLASKLGATVHLVTVVGAYTGEIGTLLTGEMIQSLTLGAREHLQTIADARRGWVTVGKCIVKIGLPADEIVETIDEVGADMIVIGSHGRQGISRFVLGSVAELVMRRAACPVLVVHLPKKIEEAKSA